MKRSKEFKMVMSMINHIKASARMRNIKTSEVYNEVFELGGNRKGKINHYRIYRIFTDALVGIDIRDFLNCYPLRKTYDGDKFDMKDYYYSKRYVDTLLSVTDVFRDEREVTEFLYEVILEEYLWCEIAVSSMMGASVYVEDRYDMNMLDSYLNYGQYEMGKKPNTPHYMKVVK